MLLRGGSRLGFDGSLYILNKGDFFREEGSVN